MIVAVLSRDRMNSIALPANVTGARWIEDARQTRLAFIEGRDGRWSIDPAASLHVRGVDGPVNSCIELDPCKRAVLNLRSGAGETWSVVFYPDDARAKRSKVYGFKGDAILSIGRDAGNAISYATRFVSARHATLTFKGGAWTCVDEGSVNGVFVNGRRVPANVSCPLVFGDVVSILDLRITVGSGLFSCNNPSGLVKVAPLFVAYCAPEPAARPDRMTTEPELFYPALRFVRSIEPRDFVIDEPPAPEPEDDTPLIMRIGPSLVMALASVLSASVSVSLFAGQEGSLIRSLPMVGMAVAMLVGSVLWPILNARSQRKRRAIKEAKRRASYSQYLGRMQTEIEGEEGRQRQILIENRVSVQECLGRAFRGEVTLMDRTPLHPDYLELRVGTGEEPLRASIRYPDQRFSVDDDDLRKAVAEQARVVRRLMDVPIAYPLIDKPILGVVGEPRFVRPFVRGLMVQLVALDSYQNLKLIMLADESDRAEWSFALHLPHCLSDDRSRRFVAFGLEEASELGMFMERVLEGRRSGQKKVEARDQQPYYVVVCASEILADKADIVHSVVDVRENLGVSLIACAREMHDLPRECRSVIGLELGGGYLLDRDDPTGARKTFTPDIGVTCETAVEFAFAMGKVRLDIRREDRQIPSRLGFLEMERVGSVDHLSIASRWAESNASATLACPVGVDAQGDPFLLNLHEKFHGPHGLIAGTTGSGKSEFIITYILSMAVTYSPADVAFVLIDYKGGGLARAFDNERVHLPHLAGVITNLDGAAVTRSLVSIKSELKRRQALFNHARDVAGGDNVDIYDYLDLYRQGRVSEPCPHLFIVADEFAELKQQEPEFMDELISAARIGRSLGVHLILATQKPSGVVNDQIWSNARFKVCLKVADEADSREMIKRTDAAALSQAGRFYLLVGYNEYFALGQAAYAGTPYQPQERYAPVTDESVTLISDTGRQLVSVKPEHARGGDADGSEAVAVLQVVQQVAAEEGLAARRLWMEPVPSMVTVDGLARKYRCPPGGDSMPDSFALAPIIGELDDPAHQRQGVLTLDLAEGGNVLVYGTADSGAELVLGSLLYGVLQSFPPAALHVYALDFGSESLRAFAEAPQVGDVIGIADEEKVNRFFGFIDKERVRRRDAMAPYGGSFVRYRAAGGSMAATVVIVNDVAAFNEAYPKLEERMEKFVRESGRYGIYLVMAADGTSSVRMRMRQTFRQLLACDLADTSDYAMIFGSVRGIPLPHGYGRGLVKTEGGIFEFQAAHLSESGDDYAIAQKMSRDMAESAATQGLVAAPPVPMVPDIVRVEDLTHEASALGTVPFGIFEDTLEIARFDFEDAAIVRAVFQRRRSGERFARSLVETAVLVGFSAVHVVDAAGLLGSEKPHGCAYATRKPEAGSAKLLEMLGRASRARDEAGAREGSPIPDVRPMLFIISGISRVLAATSYDEANELKGLLRGLTPQGGVNLVLLDAVADVDYGYDDWSKAQLSSKSGLWIGPGIDAQSTISVSYTPGLAPDAVMKKDRGYLIEGGLPRLVRLVSAPGDA